MIDPLKIATLARQARRAIPQGMRDLGAGAEDSIRQLVQHQITQLGLVDRQQFEQQCQLLQQAREQLLQLEQQVTRLEGQLASLLSIKS